eukprot:CFRG5872T1
MGVFSWFSDHAELLASILSMCALFLSTLGLSTQDWIVLKSTENPPNPLYISHQYTYNNRTTTYYPTSLGLWIVCSQQFNESYDVNQTMEQELNYEAPSQPCTYINGHCEASISVYVNDTNTVLSSSLGFLTNCPAFQVVRVFGYIYVALVLVGCTMQWGFPVFERSFLWGSSLLVLAFLSCGIIIGVWFGQVYNPSDTLYKENGTNITVGFFYQFGWSLFVFISSCVLSCLSSIIGLIHSSTQALEIVDTVKTTLVQKSNFTSRNIRMSSPNAPLSSSSQQVSIYRTPSQRGVVNRRKGTR